jgi:hypothetical protein
MAETRTDTNRVQRWREEKRKEGLKAVTVWLTTEEELRLKDVALQWHCSPSAVMQRALAQVTMSTPSYNGSPSDMLQMREVIQEELAPLQAEITAMQEALAAIQAEQVSVTDTVTESVTDTLARDLPGLVRQLVEGLALEALGFPVTETYRDVTDTEPPEEAPAPRRGGRPLGAMGQRIVALLGAHPEGLSAAEIRAYLKPERPLGDTLQSLRKRERVRTQGQGRALRYFVA